MLSLKLLALLKWVQVLRTNTGAPFLEVVLVGYLVFWLIMQNYADKRVIPVQKSGVKWSLKEDWGTCAWQSVTIPSMGHISTLSVKNTKKNNHVLTDSVKSWSRTHFMHALWNHLLIAGMNKRTNVGTDGHLIQSLSYCFSLWMSKLLPTFFFN